MTTEDKLRDLITRRYYSIREFAMMADIPYTTVHSIFKRGIDNSSVANVIKICKALGISADALADGEIQFINNRPSNLLDDTIEVKDLVGDVKDILTSRGRITLDGKPIDVGGIDSLINAMDIGVEMAKKKR